MMSLILKLIFLVSSVFDYKSSTGNSQFKFGILSKIVRYMRVSLVIIYFLCIYQCEVSNKIIFHIIFVF